MAKSDRKTYFIVIWFSCLFQFVTICQLTFGDGHLQLKYCFLRLKAMKGPKNQSNFWCEMTAVELRTIENIDPILLFICSV